MAQKGIIKKRVMSYETTDGAIFTGKGAGNKAELHQATLDNKKLFVEFDVMMSNVFGLSPEGGDYEQEHNVCQTIMEKVAIGGGVEDFSEDFCWLVFDLYKLLGPENGRKFILSSQDDHRGV